MADARRPPLVIRFYLRVFKVWRAKRFERMVAALAPQPDWRVLDVGGGPGDWGEHRPRVGEIDCLNLAEELPYAVAGYRYLSGDGCRMDLPTAGYDLAYSNSVIEHVGDFERQAAFAAEVCRVGKAVWVQTPARACPIEAHVLLPVVHWLPRPLRRSLAMAFSPRRWLFREGKDGVGRMVDETRLLGRAEMKRLFPDCEIITERMAGVFPKSYIAWRSAPPAPLD